MKLKTRFRIILFSDGIKYLHNGFIYRIENLHRGFRNVHVLDLAPVGIIVKENFTCFSIFTFVTRKVFYASIGLPRASKFLVSL